MASFAPRGPQLPRKNLARHFIYLPGGPPAFNGPLAYIVSFLFILGATAVLSVVVASVLGALAATNEAVAGVVLALQNNSLEGLGFEWLFTVVGLTFVVYLIAIFLAVPIVHRRPVVSVLTVRRHFGWGRLLAGFALYGLLLLVPIGFYVSSAGDELTYNFDPQQFLLLLAFAVPALLIQTGTEEVFFRGYLMQALGAARLPLTLVVILPSLLFAAAHLGNPEFAADPSVLGFYFGFGMFMALVSVEDEGIELAIGAHFANNLITATVLRTEDSVLETPTIYLLPSAEQGEAGGAVGAVLAPLLFWAIVLIWRRSVIGRDASR